MEQATAPPSEKGLKQRARAWMEQSLKKETLVLDCDSLSSSDSSSSESGSEGDWLDPSWVPDENEQEQRRMWEVKKKRKERQKRIRHRRRRRREEKEKLEQAKSPNHKSEEPKETEIAEETSKTEDKTTRKEEEDRPRVASLKIKGKVLSLRAIKDLRKSIKEKNSEKPVKSSTVPALPLGFRRETVTGATKDPEQRGRSEAVQTDPHVTRSKSGSPDKKKGKKKSKKRKKKTKHTSTAESLLSPRYTDTSKKQKKLYERRFKELAPSSSQKRTLTKRG